MGFTQRRFPKSAHLSLILASAFVSVVLIGAPDWVHAVGGRRPQPPVKLPDPPKVLGKYGALRISSFNIQGLPVFSTGGRLRDIGEQFRKMRADGTAPHIVCIQEAFHADTEELIERAGYPYRAYGPGPLWPKAGSGLLILSEFPLKNIVTMVFREENSTGFDWNSRKGVIKTEVRISTEQGEYQFNLFNTHVQADYFNDFMPLSDTVRARRRQFMELASFIQRHNSVGSAYLLVGDFNTYAIRDDYFDLPQMLSVRDAAEDCGAAQSQCVAYVDAIRDMKNSVDHIFYKNGYDVGSPRTMAYTASEIEPRTMAYTASEIEPRTMASDGTRTMASDGTRTMASDGTRTMASDGTRTMAPDGTRTMASVPSVGPSVGNAKNIEQWQPVYYQKSFRDPINGRQLSDHLSLDVHFIW